MDNESIDERIKRLVRELEEARQEKLGGLLPLGTVVGFIAEIVEIDKDDFDRPYRVEINDGNGDKSFLWLSADKVKEIK